MPPKDWDLDKDWADGYGAQIARIIKANVGALIDVRTASAEQDIKQATDLVVSVPAGEIALRIRREDCAYRDLTLRYRRRGQTGWADNFEVQKILAGFARWYFYAWTKGRDIGDWMLVDLEIVRESGLIEDAIDEGREKTNDDGATTFTWLTRAELWGIGAIVAENTDNPTRVRTRDGHPLPTYEEVVEDFAARPLRSHCTCASCRAEAA